MNMYFLEKVHLRTYCERMFTWTRIKIWRYFI